MENEAEKWVSNLCKKTFFSIWSYPNPLNPIKDYKELCDLLIVCDPDVIIFSVKDVKIKKSDDALTDYKRWVRRVIDDSVRQIFGAERHIRQMEEVITKDKERALRMPENPNIYRVSIALGSSEEFGVYSSFFRPDKFVHVIDQKAFGIIITELDTISDFIKYLDDKEKFLPKTMLEEGEEDILGYYLLNNRTFPEAAMVFFTSGIWEECRNHPDYKRKKEADRISYIWDGIIKEFIHHLEKGSLTVQLPSQIETLANTEEALRFMARESRFNRRYLGFQFKKMVDNGVRARVVPLTNVCYVYLTTEHNPDLPEQRKRRINELHARCIVARDITGIPNLIGLATEMPFNPKCHSFDLIYIDYYEWGEEEIQKAKKLKEGGIFKDINVYGGRFFEFPSDNK